MSRLGDSLDAERSASFFSNKIGGGRYWYMLKASGMTYEEISTELARMMEEERDEIEKFAGGELDHMPAKWKDTMIHLTAMRLLVERKGAHSPDLEKAKAEEDSERIEQSVRTPYYETDDDFEEIDFE